MYSPRPAGRTILTAERSVLFSEGKQACPAMRDEETSAPGVGEKLFQDFILSRAFVTFTHQLIVFDNFYRLQYCTCHTGQPGGGDMIPGFFRRRRIRA